MCCTKPHKIVKRAYVSDEGIERKLHIEKDWINVNSLKAFFSYASGILSDYWYYLTVPQANTFFDAALLAVLIAAPVLSFAVGMLSWNYR